MNFLRGSVVPGEGDGCFRCASGLFPLPERWRGALAAFSGREVVLGFRPEAIAVASDATSDGARIKGTVDVVEPMGAETFVQVASEAGTRVIARMSPDRSFKPGTTIDLSVSLEHAVFFDAASGILIVGNV